MKVSVIVPVYNKIQYLETLYECLRKQTLLDFECVLVDDGSTDGSSAQCDAFSDADKRFKTVHIPNGGVSRARNIGMEIAHGDYITFVDADDSVPENHLECLYGNTAQNKADMTICSATKIWSSGKQLNVNLPEAGICTFEDLLPTFASYQRDTGIYGYCCGKMFRKQLGDGIQFDEKICLAEDFDFFLKLYAKVNKICFTTETTYYYLQEAENSSAVVNDAEIDYRTQLLIQIRYKLFLENKKAYSGENQSIVSQLLSNYVFYTLFYCEKYRLDACINELQLVCKRENIELRGRNSMERWILGLFAHNKFGLLKVSIIGYRLAKKLIRGR